MTRKTLLLTSAILLAHLSYGQITDPAPYCAAGYDDMGGTFPVPHYISNVTLGTLNNTSGDTQYAAPHYVYYNNIAVPDLMAGHAYNLSVTHDPPPSTLHFVAVYIDYNHNNSFNDSGERVLQQTATASTITNPSIASITIPQTATPGITRMRVMVFEDDTYPGPNATSCTADASGSLDWGETEDYNVNIVATTDVTGPDKKYTAFVYPNPAQNTICVDQSFLGAEITITDLQGRIALQRKIIDTRIGITSLVPGAYFIKIINNGVVNTQPLIVVE